MQLSVKNFQSWSDATLDIDGLTVLVGPSNRGKSALFRALKGVLRNDIPEEFIRNNQDEPLEIELELDKVIVKAIRKRKGSTKYTIVPLPRKFQINKAIDVLYDSREEAEVVAKQLTPLGEVKVYEKVYSSLGGKVPEEVERLKFGEVKIGDYNVDPIFANQNKAQFLIDSDRWGPQERNAILGAFSSTEKLDAGKKEANLRITQRKSEANTLASEIRSAEERSAALLEITGEVTIIADSVLALETGIRSDEMTVGQLESVLYHQSRLQPLQEILDTLTLPDLTAVTTLLLMVEGLSSATQALLVSQFLRKVEGALNSTATTWADLLVTYKQGKMMEELLVFLDKQRLHHTECIDRLTSIVEQVEAQLVEVKTLNSSISYLVTAVDAFQAHKSLISQLTDYTSQLEVAEAELESTRQELATIEANKIKQGICKRCGRSLEHICQ